MNSLANKVALITGATSGIGAASAIRFSEAGAYVLVAGRNKARGDEIVKSILAKDCRGEFLEMDMENDESINGVVDYLSTKFGKLDILFNNAGIIPVPPQLEETTREDINSLFNTNVQGLCMMTIKSLPLLKKCHGVILNNASIGGLQSYSVGRGYIYSASKAAVIKFTQMLAKNEAPKIRANIICPGVVKTPVYKKFDEERYKSNIPLGRVGEAEDIAFVANFLVSDDAAFINGAVIVVDGGQSL